jgi:hypothetical protein
MYPNERLPPKSDMREPSTIEQNLTRNIAVLTAAGCGMVRTEQKSGAGLEGQPEIKTIPRLYPSKRRWSSLASTGWPVFDLQTIVSHLKSSA